MTLQYEVVERIAVGGMAEVYRARAIDESGRGSVVCIKRILPHLTRDPRSLSMFVDEARLAASLDSPFIVQVYDLCMSPSGEHFIVMEYVEGMDLARVLSTCRKNGARIPIDVVARIAIEMCKGLHVAHEHKDPQGVGLDIIHRDISPQNILLSRGGDVKITDFGIAKSSIVMTTTALGVLKGKYGYMSPEQASGQPLDRRSDLFNVGILMYEMLVGERCFAGSSDYSTLELMREAVVVPPSHTRHDVDSELEKVVMKALSKRKEDRFSTARELEQAILLCPRARPCDRETLVEFLNDIEGKAERPQRVEKSEVLSLASIVEGPASSKPTEPDPVHTSEDGDHPRPSKAALVLASALAAGVTFLVLRTAYDPVDALNAVQTAQGAGGDVDETTVVVTSEPPGARVFVDGLEMAGTTPFVLQRPLDGELHEVRLLLSGHEAASASVRWSDEDALQVLRLRLEPTPPPSAVAMIHFEASDRARVFVDEVLILEARRGELAVPAGEPIRLTFEGPSGGIRSMELELPEGAKRELLVELPHGPPAADEFPEDTELPAD
ncbi:MAG: serine/threonine-protein kinase [Myxococcota bacterium]